MEHGTHNAYTNHGCRCAACWAAEKTYQREYRERNKERLLAYDRSPERDSRLRDDRERRLIRQRTYDTLARGREKEPCEGCGGPSAQLHHDDYDRPLDVRWLCPSCHGIEHRKIEAGQFEPVNVRR